MQKHPHLTRQRVLNFAKLAPLLNAAYPERAPVRLASWAAPGRVPYEEARSAAYRPIEVGHKFEPLWSTHWVRVDIVIPKAWKGREVHLLWDSQNEACVWINGSPRQGLTGTGRPFWGTLGDRPLRPEYRLTECARGGERIEVLIEVACNLLFGMEQVTDQTNRLRQAEIAAFDRDAWALHWDFATLAEMMEHLPPDQPRGAQALYAANAFVNTILPEGRATWPKARRIARSYLSARNGDGQHSISAIGHAHIDTAWLWPLAETRRKCYRSFSTMMRLLEEYPEFKFACSQAQQYDWIRTGQPKLYAEIKRHVREGRFIPVGGTWIEPDCNIPSGESLVRQFVHGQRFFKREFGRYCRGFWNPDVFGYNGQLPQIIRSAGMHWFLTQKLSWNQTNKPDSHTFWWEGIDGSRVLTHFPPTDTYNGVATIAELLFHVRNYKDLDRSNESCYLFGIGDGGGGPTREMLERLRRAGDVDGVPRVQVRAPDEFFERLERDGRDWVSKVGELYLEFHRGTLTTQAACKRDNRRAEEGLHDAEFLHAIGTGAYPRKELDRVWKLVLLNQFHDIIPGSSIREVYEDAARDYADVLGSLRALRAKALRAMAGATGPRVLVANTLDFPRREIVRREAGAEGIVHAPAMGVAVQTPSGEPDHPVRVRETARQITLENEHIRVRISRDGRLAELYHKRTGRSLLAEPGNRFALYDDHPNSFDAWDVDVFHAEKCIERPVAKSVSLLEQSPCSATVVAEYHIGGNSRMTQHIRLDALSPYLEFLCEVDWHETHRLLKVEFPTSVRSPSATYEMQFGHVQRPTHYNTSQDLMRFEVCAHRWADLSEPGCGLALMNDGKYGHSAYGGEMRLSLLRAPVYPDPEADRGHHVFRYACYPHGGDWREARVPQFAAAFNQPLLLAPTAHPESAVSFFQVEHPAIRIDTVKLAEEGGEVVLRLYESHGSTVRTRLHTHRSVHRAWEGNLLEEERKPLRTARDGILLRFRPFEIKTVILDV